MTIIFTFVYPMNRSNTHKRARNIYFSPINFKLFIGECKRKGISYSSRINEMLNKEYASYSSNEKQSLREFYERNLK